MRPCPAAVAELVGCPGQHGDGTEQVLDQPAKAQTLDAVVVPPSSRNSYVPCWSWPPELEKGLRKTPPAAPPAAPKTRGGANATSIDSASSSFTQSTADSIISSSALQRALALAEKPRAPSKSTTGSSTGIAAARAPARIPAASPPRSDALHFLNLYLEDTNSRMHACVHARLPACPPARLLACMWVELNSCEVAVATAGLSSHSLTPPFPATPMPTPGAAGLLRGRRAWQCRRQRRSRLAGHSSLRCCFRRLALDKTYRILTSDDRH